MATLGELGDKLYAKNEEIAGINAKLKEKEDEKRAIEDKLLAAMLDANTTICRGNKATISISENVRPQIQDLEKFYRYVLRHKALHLFERRIAAVAYRELKDSLKGKPIPGLTDFVQQRLNVRKIAND